MTDRSKLVTIKIIHTAIWIFFNIVIFYMLYAVTLGEINIWLWIGFGLIGIEAIVLLIFKFFCPLTLIARKYSESQNDNFDIYLPNWLARYTKVIYTLLVFVILCLAIYRII
ncbi:MAG: hypothetical protein HC811_09755 [Flammeovirgaceae bacterium]|nr:hypothetical protein [Flammeovirgaceae bacterium]